MVKWIGFDYGQCLMDSSNRKVEYWMAAVFIDEEKERPGIINEKVKLYNELIEKYGDFRRLHEKGRHEVEEKVLENNPCLIKRYYEVEQKLLKPADGAEDALRYLKKKGYVLDVVSDMSTVNVIINFLNNYNLRHFFSNIYSPIGVVRESGEIDESFKGVSKEDGSLYEKLKEDLERRGIDVSEAVMVGDHPVKDVEMAKKYGFITVHYDVKGKPSDKADYVISHFSELKKIF
ncbi:Haloacid dehalogenase domain protein hydrolase [Ferroglobus placidus DSM 10642]|uniref:Haloacid dehalogenase domain protein hydrolase n=1 Tax=Ferroglobus placidus (strain DSM 10642 / AEDII12DO) TaxID=589924 RepID=D3S143_FERPA|nr:HAD family hydrolase [Ferroglobus placidus]ADC64279.1 Haloacid dehalogenase domain protein hydrolase [Ferroglobus placidus DSM 10642]